MAPNQAGGGDKGMEYAVYRSEGAYSYVQDTGWDGLASQMDDVLASRVYLQMGTMADAGGGRWTTKRCWISLSASQIFFVHCCMVVRLGGRSGAQAQCTTISHGPTMAGTPVQHPADVTAFTLYRVRVALPLARRSALVQGPRPGLGGGHPVPERLLDRFFPILPGCDASMHH